MANLIDLLAQYVDAKIRTLAVCHDNEPDGFRDFIARYKADVFTRQAGQGVTPKPWLNADKKYQQVFLPLTKGRDVLELYLANIASQLDGVLYVFGFNDDGIKSADKIISKYFGNVECIATGGHGRIFTARQPLKTNYHLADFSQHVTLDITGQPVSFETYPGLFAKSKLDEATKLLIDHLPQTSGAISVLDYACGLGTLARAVQLQNTTN